MYQNVVFGGDRENASSSEDSDRLIPWMKRQENGFVALILSALAAGFGNSLEPVSILTFVHIYLLLTGFEIVLGDDVIFSWNTAKICGFILITQALGFCLGFVGMMGYPKTTAASVFQAIAFGALVWISYILLALLPSFSYLRKYPTSITSIFVFPVLHTVAYCSVLGNGFSTFAALGNSVLDYAPLRQLSTLLGIYGINFVTVLIGSFPAFLTSRYNQLNQISMNTLKRNYLRALVIIFITTGFLIQSKYLYQVHIPKLTPKKIPVSCVFAQTVDFNSPEYYQLWNTTQSHVIAGDNIILMSEEAMKLTSSSQENEVISNAINLAQATTVPTGVLIGFTYILDLPGKEYSTNQFILVSSEQTTPLWQYKKAHPVPLVESDVEAGLAELPYAHTNYGYLSGAICFDLDFPQYIADAGRNEVDIFLQPSWTWNAINFRHFEGDALRAIENGFTLFRCSSDGESGIVDPYGKFLARQYTSHYPNDVSVFQLPLNNRVTTFYPFLGFIIEYLFIVSTFIYYISINWNIKVEIFGLT